MGLPVSMKFAMDPNEARQRIIDLLHRDFLSCRDAHANSIGAPVEEEMHRKLIDAGVVLRDAVVELYGCNLESLFKLDDLTTPKSVYDNFADRFDGMMESIKGRFGNESGGVTNDN